MVKTQFVPAKVAGTYRCACEVPASSCDESYRISNNIRKTRKKKKQEFGRFEFLTCYALSNDPRRGLNSLTLRVEALRSRETTLTITSQHGATSQNTLIFVKTAVRTHNHSRIFRQAFVNYCFPGQWPSTVLAAILRGSWIKLSRHVNTVGTLVDTQELASERKNMWC